MRSSSALWFSLICALIIIDLLSSLGSLLVIFICFLFEFVPGKTFTHFTVHLFRVIITVFICFIWEIAAVVWLILTIIFGYILEFGVFSQLTVLIFTFLSLIFLQESPSTRFKEGFEVISDLCQDCIPVHWHYSLRIKDTDFVQISFNLVKLFSWDRVDVLECLEIFIDNGHVEVLDAEGDTLKMNCFYVVKVDTEKWELTDCDKTIHGGSDLYNWLLRAALECKLVDWNIKHNNWTCLLRLVLNKLRKVEELLAQFFLRLSFPVFKLKFVEIVHSSAASFHVNVICSNTGFFEELDVLELFVVYCHWDLESEVDNWDELVLLARLKESMLNVWEWDIHLEALSGNVSHSVGVDF